MFTLTQLQYFEAVAEHESMTVAAARLHVSQSAVSSAIAQLERVLNVQLFIRRRNRTVVLSTAGKQFAKQTRAFLEHAEDLYESTQGSDGALTGSVRIGIYSPIAPFRLPRILAEFERRHPGIHVDFVEGHLAEVHNALRAADCELALMYGHGLGEGFETKTVEVIPPHVLVAADHPAANKTGPVCLADFADEPFIQLDLPLSKEYYEALFRLANITPTVRHCFNDYETVRSFVGMGHGYAVLNQQLGPFTYAGGEVVALPLTDRFPGVDVMLVWPEHTRLTRRAQAFIDVCAELYQSAHWTAVKSTER